MTAAAPSAAGFWPRRRMLALSAVALLIVAAIATAVVWRLHPRTTTTGTEFARLDMPVAPAEELNADGDRAIYAVASPGGSRTALAWTPDGRALVFVGRRGDKQQLYVREMGQQEARPLPGTEGAQIPTVSADGQYVAFWADGMIRKVTISNGLVDTMVHNVLATPFGMSWSDAGLLIGIVNAAHLGLSAGSGSIFRYTPGGELRQITTRQQGELCHVLPQWLPGNKAFLYTARKRTWTWSNDQVFAYVAATGERKQLLTKAVDARYAAGHLFYLWEKRLYAVAFDESRLELRGEAVLIMDNVAQALANRGGNDSIGAGQFSISATGILAYI